MDKRQNCLHRHANGNCLFNGGFCLANNEKHCLKIKEDDSYNQALDDVDNIITEQLDNSDNQVECQTLRWVLDVLSDLIK